MNLNISTLFKAALEVGYYLKQMDKSDIFGMANEFSLLKGRSISRTPHLKLFPPILRETKRKFNSKAAEGVKAKNNLRRKRVQINMNAFFFLSLNQSHFSHPEKASEIIQPDFLFLYFAADIDSADSAPDGKE